MSAFRFPNNCQSIIITIKISGPKGSRFIRAILDTGATYTMIAPEILQTIGCDMANPSRKLTITTASSIEYVPFYVLEKVSALGKEESNLEVASHSFPPKVPADGLLGLNFLRKYKLTLCVNEGFLELE